jgi:hypothetical protein
VALSRLANLWNHNLLKLLNLFFGQALREWADGGRLQRDLVVSNPAPDVPSFISRVGSPLICPQIFGQPEDRVSSGKSRRQAKCIAGILQRDRHLIADGPV